LRTSAMPHRASVRPGHRSRHRAAVCTGNAWGQDAMTSDIAPQRRRILTWNVHGNYLHALAHVPHEWIVPVDGTRPGYTPPTPHLDWPDTLRLVAPGDLRRERLDAIVYQSRDNLADAACLLGSEQLALPSIYIEHNPPEPHPTDTWHPF